VPRSGHSLGTATTRRCYSARNRIRRHYLLLLFSQTTLGLLPSSWLALFPQNRDQAGRGIGGRHGCQWPPDHYDHRVRWRRRRTLGETGAFVPIAWQKDLEGSRALAELDHPVVSGEQATGRSRRNWETLSGDDSQRGGGGVKLDRKCAFWQAKRASRNPAQPAGPSRTSGMPLNQFCARNRR